MYDVVVLGAGLAGAGIASLLSQQGGKVVILDKGDSPSFKLPETALINHAALFEKLGLTAADCQSLFLREMHACIKSPDGSQEIAITHRFTDNSDGAAGEKLYRVDRSRLDYLILQKAIQSGAIYKPGADVQFINIETNSVVYKELGECKTLTAKFIIDATGKSAVLANQYKTKEAVHTLDERQLIFSHFEESEFRKTLTNNAVYITEISQGYIFVIPLRGNRFSVGTVLSAKVPCNKKQLENTFNSAIVEAGWIASALETSNRKLPYILATQETFISNLFCNENYLLIGEATGFLDPFYSNGVAITCAMIEKAFIAVTGLLSDEPGNFIANYNAEVKQLIRDQQYNISQWLEQNSLKINASSLSDPHLPYGVVNFLSHFSNLTAKNNPAATMQSLRQRFAEA